MERSFRTRLTLLKSLLNKIRSQIDFSTRSRDILKTQWFRQNTKTQRNYLKSFQSNWETRWFRKHTVRSSRKSSFSGVGQWSSTTPLFMNWNQSILELKNCFTNNKIKLREFILFILVKSSCGLMLWTLSKMRDLLHIWELMIWSLKTAMEVQLKSKNQDLKL